MSRSKSDSVTREIPTEEELLWRLTVPCVAIPCATIEDAEAALTALAMLDNYCAGAITALEDSDYTALAYLTGRIPDWPGIVRTWLSGRAARNLGLPNPLDRLYEDQEATHGTPG